MPDASADGRLLADGLRMQSAEARRPARRHAARAAPGTRSRPRSATRRRSRTVIYIIKENRTYDQVFGDMPEGNGEPSLCLFPEAVTPNHHALVREFVLLDNFYVDGEVSADGHEWTMGAYATDFVERTWPLGYRGDRRVPYPVGGRSSTSPGRPAATSGTAPPRRGSATAATASSSRTARPRTSPARRASRPRRATSTRCSAASTWTIPTSKRADRFLEELAGFEKAGDMPRLVDPAAAQRPHLGHHARQADPDGLRGR